MKPIFRVVGVGVVLLLLGGYVTLLAIGGPFLRRQVLAAASAVPGRVTCGAVHLRVPFTVEVNQLQVVATPEVEEPLLNIRRVTIRPSWLSLVSRRLIIAAVVIEDPELKIIRLPDRSIHTVAWAPPQAAAAPSASALPTILRCEVRNGVVAWEDAFLNAPAVNSRLERLQALFTVDRAHAQSGRILATVSAVLRNAPGTAEAPFTAEGWMDPATGTFTARFRLQALEVVPYQAYLSGRLLAPLASGQVSVEADVQSHPDRRVYDCRFQASDVRFENAADLSELASLQQLLDQAVQRGRGTLAEHIVWEGPPNQFTPLRIRRLEGDLVPVLLAHGALGGAERLIIRIGEQTQTTSGAGLSALEEGLRNLGSKVKELEGVVPGTGQ